MLDFLEVRKIIYIIVCMYVGYVITYNITLQKQHIINFNLDVNYPDRHTVKSAAFMHA